MMENMIPPQVGMRLRKKREKEKERKKKGGKGERKRKKEKKKKKREGALLVSFTTLVLQSSTMFFI